MGIDSVYGISERGLVANTNEMARIAGRIARNNGDSQADLVRDITDMTMVQRNYEANVNVIQTADDMYRELLSFY